MNAKIVTYFLCVVLISPLFAGKTKECHKNHRLKKYDHKADTRDLFNQNSINSDGEEDQSTEMSDGYSSFAEDLADENSTNYSLDLEYDQPKFGDKCISKQLRRRNYFKHRHLKAPLSDKEVSSFVARLKACKAKMDEPGKIIKFEMHNRFIKELSKNPRLLKQAFADYKEEMDALLSNLSWAPRQIIYTPTVDTLPTKDALIENLPTMRKTRIGLDETKTAYVFLRRWQHVGEKPNWKEITTKELYEIYNTQQTK